MMVQDKYTSKTLNPIVLKWIKLTLTHDDISSDEELIEYFTNSEKTLSRREARKWVARRKFYRTYENHN